MIAPETLTRLPLTNRATITPDYLDEMGHMNIRWYLAIFDDATWQFFEEAGLSLAYFKAENTGMFALQQHIRYLAEVRVDQSVAIHTRVLGRSAKRIHFIHFMINETTGVLAASVETVGTHMNMEIRRTSPFPDHLASHLDALRAEYSHIEPPHPTLLNP